MEGDGVMYLHIFRNVQCVCFVMEQVGIGGESWKNARGSGEPRRVQIKLPRILEDQVRCPNSTPILRTTLC